MALILAHKINQGVHIEGRGQSLDLIVRSIRGDRSWCETKIEICRQTESTSLQINTDSPDISVLEEFSIGLLGKYARHSVKIAYSADWDYQIRRKDYRRF